MTFGAPYTVPPRIVIYDWQSPYQCAARAVQQQVDCIRRIRELDTISATAFKAKVERDRGRV